MCSIAISVIKEGNMKGLNGFTGSSAYYPRCIEVSQKMQGLFGL